MLTGARRGNKYGFVDGFGKIKIPFIYDNCHKSHVYDNTSSDHFTAICQNGKWGFIDTSSSEGKIIVSPQYKRVGDFFFGMAWVNDGKDISFIDKAGKIVCSGIKQCSSFNANGLAGVRFERNSKKGYFINKRGEIVYCYDIGENGKIYNLRRKE